jgi:hypothetical protein
MLKAIRDVGLGDTQFSAPASMQTLAEAPSHLKDKDAQYRALQTFGKPLNPLHQSPARRSILIRRPRTHSPSLRSQSL